MRTLFGDQVLRPLVVTFLIFLLSLIVINVAEVLFITRTLHSTALVYGLVSTAFGVGNIVGAVASSKIKQDGISLVRAALLGIVVIGVSVGAIGLVEYVGYVFPLLAVTGVAAGVVNVAASTLLTIRTPEKVRGAMFAATNAIFTSAEIASTALGGLILTLIAPRTVFQLAGIVSTAGVLLIGPFTLRASRAAKALEVATQGE
jgi:MFS family permease